MIPIFIKILKALHPAQNPMKASNEANEISIVNKTIEILFNPTTWKLVISKEKTSPTPCANLLGGPGTIFSLKFNLGTIILVTKRAKGLIFGPEETLARNPYISILRST